MSDKVLKGSVQSAGLNVLASLFFRMFTFVANAYILRCVTRDVLGVGVRTTLLFDTVLFLSREAFRKACLSKPVNGDWRGTINLVWLSVPIGALLSLLLGYVWIHLLELPAQDVDQYTTAIKLVCLNSIIILAAEPFYIVGQVFLHVKFRSGIDLLYLCTNSALQCFVVTLWPEKAILYYALAGLFNSCLFLLLNAVYFWNVVRNHYAEAKKDDNRKTKVDYIPFSSVRDFLPDLSGFKVDQNRWQLSLSFFRQGFLKQLLTEGEKYMITWFNLMTLPEQGVYDVIANLGSIPARLFFSKMEESAHFYFSQTVSRGQVSDAAKEAVPSGHLHVLLKALVLLGAVVCTFGVSYSHLLLHIYGGDLLSAGLGPTLLKAHCLFIMFLAVNGISECYAFCAMTTDEVSRYNYLMAAMTAVFLGCTWLFAKAMGPVGFTVANCCNFSMRIAHNFAVIGRRHAGAKMKDPLSGLLPTKMSILMLAVAGVACQMSERYVYEATLVSSLGHIAVGGVMFVLTMVVIAFKEPWLRELIDKKFRRKSAP